MEQLLWSEWVPARSVLELLAGWGTGPQLCGSPLNGSFVLFFVKYFDFKVYSRVFQLK